MGDAQDQLPAQNDMASVNDVRDSSITNPSSWSRESKNSDKDASAAGSSWDWVASMGTVLVLYSIYLPVGLSVAKHPLNALRVATLSLVAGCLGTVVLMVAAGLRAREYATMKPARRVLYVV
jgi:hypothetical protein